MRYMTTGVVRVVLLCRSDSAVVAIVARKSSWRGASRPHSEKFKKIQSGVYDTLGVVVFVVVSSALRKVHYLE